MYIICKATFYKRPWKVEGLQEQLETKKLYACILKEYSVILTTSFYGMNQKI